MNDIQHKHGGLVFYLDDYKINCRSWFREQREKSVMPELLLVSGVIRPFDLFSLPLAISITEGLNYRQIGLLSAQVCVYTCSGGHWHPKDKWHCRWWRVDVHSPCVWATGLQVQMLSSGYAGVESLSSACRYVGSLSCICRSGHRARAPLKKKIKLPARSYWSDVVWLLQLIYIFHLVHNYSLYTYQIDSVPSIFCSILPHLINGCDSPLT